jgi:TfoX/Sxy family transcriptional regulator of competence genes
MAYDEELADRVRNVLEARSDVSERKMFGGIAFMLAGNLAAGVLGEDLIVRVGPEDHAAALSEPGVREFDFSGRPSKGIVFVEPDQVRDDGGLARWVDAGADFAASLPPKPNE